MGIPHLILRYFHSAISDLHDLAEWHLREKSSSCLLPRMASLDPSAADTGPTTPVRTRPLDEAQRGAWFEGPDVVTALRVHDGDREYALPPGPTFTLGASRSCDVPVRGRDISALHCAFVRTGSRLRVYDQHSTNGLYAGGRRVEAIDLYPGDTFTAAPVTFLAMNDEMRAQRPIIADIVGAAVGSSSSPRGPRTGRRSATS